MLVCGSMHDERVPYWMPLKWIAKMRQENKKTNEKEATPSKTSKLFLCTIDEGGHFGSGGIEGVFEEVLCDCLRFFPPLPSSALCCSALLRSALSPPLLCSSLLCSVLLRSALLYSALLCRSALLSFLLSSLFSSLI